jgi:uncharacterized iron-regulated protein
MKAQIRKLDTDRMDAYSDTTDDAFEAAIERLRGHLSERFLKEIEEAYLEKRLHDVPSVVSRFRAVIADEMEDDDKAHLDQGSSRDPDKN